MLKSPIHIILIVIICLGIMHIVIYHKKTITEGLTTINGNLRCPNLLIQKGPKYYLYNSNVAQVPGVNPIEFNNLEEYTEFLEWQRAFGIRCPVLYVCKAKEYIKFAQVLANYRGDYLQQLPYLCQ